MTIMERNTNPNVFTQTTKFSATEFGITNTETRNSIPNLTNSRRNSTTGSINFGSNGIPASNLSLTSTSSASSSVHSPTSKYFVPKIHSVHSSRHNSVNNKHESSSSPQSSRRPSGNSITIKIIAENNDPVWDDIIKESDVNTYDEEEIEREREYQKDRDDGEDTTSNSTTNDYSPGGKHKKLKERKQLMRSSVQQQHHLTYQESEDLIDSEQPKYHEILQAKNMNSAFDELFAAAQSGNNSVSAMIEAKMAAEAAAINGTEPEVNLMRNNNSFKQTGIRRMASSFKQPRIKDENSIVNRVTNNLKTDGYLGSPKQLTRSCSCKRPGSFKKMKSKNASPNRTPINQEPSWDITPTESTSRRNFSVTPNSNRRTSSLPFESFILQQQQQQGQTLTSPDDQIETYRVRQFVTSKGSVINRGDSFKRSFKRSNQSISSNPNNSKKDISSPSYLDTNTLNLPEIQDGAIYMSKSSNGSNFGISETSFTNCEAHPVNIKMNNSEENNIEQNQQVIAPIIQVQDSIRTCIVYVLGASTVGKNSLIKQFKTSEYRGIYEISPNPQKEDEMNEGVSVMLDGVESKLQFVSMDIDMIKPNSLSEITNDNDAYIIVYSISDKSSFNVAFEILKAIRSSEFKNQPVILVGNKSDLVRKRSISREDGRYLALRFGSKFVETSVAINDRIDDLLAGILKQIRLKEVAEKENKNDSDVQIIISQLQAGHQKKHTRNLSDAQINDIVKKTTNVNNANSAWYKSNTLTRKFFKSTKNRELIRTDSEKSKNSIKVFKSNPSSKTDLLSMHTNNSFFQKIFNNIFKKKSSNSDMQSVENLFTMPVTLKTTTKGKEK
ncbi:unnamed protein product [Brachionus calyciflorus]|uniref:Uncharacterized protein n=1 Tax=Brachionus calyciflorus TaxID=104777 RepID=A0A813VM15_9BILA|nr:unnamed protein product [Brachionus calyciflorus]